jgi:hypothetical protein
MKYLLLFHGNISDKGEEKKHTFCYKYLLENRVLYEIR